MLKPVRPLEVLHVVRGLANSSGTTHIVVNLSEEQARQGASVTVLTVEKDSQPWIAPSSGFVESRCFPMSLPLRNPGVSFPLAREIRKRIAKFDFVHVHAIWNFPSYYTMRASSRAGVPYMVAPQGSMEPWALRQNRWGKLIYGTLLEKPWLKKATCLQAVSAVEAKQIKAYGLSNPVSIIPNGVSASLLERRKKLQLSTELGLDGEHKTILFLSRLHPKKGPDTLLRAFSMIPQTTPLVLVIAGSDAGSGFANKLRNLAQELGVQDRCFFIGEVRGEDKYRTLAGADLFALPSYSEGLPVAVIEAMACGLPVCITPGCNLPDVERWEAGMILPQQTEGFSQGICEMLHNPDRAREMGRNARRLVQAKFTWTSIARDTLNVYKSVLDGTDQRHEAKT